MRGDQALATVNNGKNPQSYTLLTGFEDTEMTGDEPKAGAPEQDAVRRLR